MLKYKFLLKNDHSEMSFSFSDYSELGELPPRSPLEPVCEDGPFGPVPAEKKRTPRELRELWQKAILQQILLLRMEKENQKLQGWIAVFYTGTGLMAIMYLSFEVNHIRCKRPTLQRKQDTPTYIYLCKCVRVYVNICFLFQS